MEHKSEIGYFHLALAVIASCFIPCKYVSEQSKSHNKLRQEEWKENNFKFAKSKLLKMTCDLSDNFEYNKVRKRIVSFTKNYNY